MEGTDLNAAGPGGTPDTAATMFQMAVRQPPRQTTLARRQEFQHRHPEVRFLLPRHTPSGLWEATWPGIGADEHPGHDTCAGLLDYLEARFDRGDLCGAYDEPGAGSSSG